MSQREFARQSGLSHSLISIIEMGKNPQTGKKMIPDIETYKKIATAMKITLNDLFGMLDSDEGINLKPFLNDFNEIDNKRIVIHDSEIFRKILFAMSPLDYVTVMEIFERTEKKLRDLGEL